MASLVDCYMPPEASLALRPITSNPRNLFLGTNTHISNGMITPEMILDINGIPGWLLHATRSLIGSQIWLTKSNKSIFRYINTFGMTRWPLLVIILDINGIPGWLLEATRSLIGSQTCVLSNRRSLFVRHNHTFFKKNDLSLALRYGYRNPPNLFLGTSTHLLRQRDLSWQ